jgi:lipopolysaccharide/colanic/teichoic acid biosynthesis glycosyltransferase
MAVQILRDRATNSLFKPGIGYILVLFVAVVIPYALLTISRDTELTRGVFINSAIANAFAIMLGIWIQRNIASLPGARAAIGAIPALLIGFSVVFLVILIGRIPYSRLSLIIAASISIITLYLFTLMAQKSIRLSIALIPGGRVSKLKALPEVEWTAATLHAPPGEYAALAVDLDHNHNDAWDARIADHAIAGTPVYHFKDLLESLTGRTELEHLSENSFGTLGPNMAFMAVKSVIDRVVAIAALIILAPLLLIVALIIKLDSRGPALFIQERIGYRGEPFNVIKFRTMRHKNGPVADTGIDEFITQDQDSRITAIGQFLRRSRIDELPQIINVALGQMSWIGPRPEAAALSQWYKDEIPFYRYRHIVKPGISGWAQVNQGHVADIHAVREKLQYDFYYIKNFSFWTDLFVIAKTIQTMVTGFGAK